jgi:hypothetical protein
MNRKLARIAPPGLVVLALGFLLLCMGCGAAGSGGGGAAIFGDTSVTWNVISGKVYFVLWTNTTMGPAGSGSGSGPGGHEFNGSIGPDKKPLVKWKGQTRDGKTGTVTINGTSYELTKGGLFLVSVNGEKATVRQLNTDLSAVEPSAKGLENFARTDPEVAKFVASAAKPK